MKGSAAHRSHGRADLEPESLDVRVIGQVALLIHRALDVEGPLLWLLSGRLDHVRRLLLVQLEAALAGCNLAGLGRHVYRATRSSDIEAGAFGQPQTACVASIQPFFPVYSVHKVACVLHSELQLFGKLVSIETGLFLQTRAS